MRPNLLLLPAAALIVALSTGCASAPAAAPAPPEAAPAADPEPSRPGSGCDSLIPISATDTRTGIGQENAWIREHYPGFRKTGQDLIFCAADRPADLIHIVGPDGDEVEVLFDISNFFGKM